MDINFKQWLLSEMPITNFNLVGKWGQNDKKYGYNAQDIGILTNPKAVDKIHRKWSNSRENFELYFLRETGAAKYRETGEVSREWVKQNLNMDLPPENDTITIIFTNNQGADKVPLTSWTMAHRIAHAVRKDNTFEAYFTKEIRNDFRFIINELWPTNSTQAEPVTDYHLAMNVGGMKSVRENNLRNFDEFMYELVAQYLTTQKGIQFKPLDRHIITQQRFAWGRPNHKYKYVDPNKLENANDELKGLADKYTHYLDTIFGGLINRIFVM